ncbi:hypothetical protein ACJ41O_006540 [Fusarium nematophilum]
MKFSIAAAVAIIPAVFAAPALNASPKIEERQSPTQVKVTIFAVDHALSLSERVPVDGHWHGLSSNLNAFKFNMMNVEPDNPHAYPAEWTLIRCASRYRENGQVTRSDFLPFSTGLRRPETPIHGLCFYWEGESGRSGRGTCA